MNKRISIITLFFLGLSQFALAQIKEEKLILDRKREPEVKNIEKKKTSVAAEKNYPPKEKKTQDSLNLRYQITNVPAASDFKTSTIQGEDISPKFDADHQNSYFQLGMGNFGRVLADGNIVAKLENNLEVGADLHILSTSGLKKEYPWSSKQNTGNVAAYLNSYNDKGKFNVIADYGLNDYNYYGIYAFDPSADVNLKQKTNHFKVNGYYDFYSNEILNDIRVKSSFLSDHFDARETQAEIVANFSKHDIGLPINDFILNADVGLGVETLNTDFKLLHQNTTRFQNATVSPKLTFFKGDSYLMIGSDFSFFSGKYNNNLLAEQQKSNKTYWFPRAEVLFSAAQEFKFYAGVKGGLTLNSYAYMLEENPYLVSDQQLRPTEVKYKGYVGIRGDIDQTIKYDFNAGFGKVNDILFYSANDLFDTAVADNRAAYDYANTFAAVYDNGTVSEVNASVQYFPLANLVLSAEAQFTKYDLDVYEHIYNVPLLRANIGANYTLLGKKLTLGTKMIFATDRTTNSFSYTASGTSPDFYVSNENGDDKVGGFADLNLSAEYRIHKNFSIFAHGNNLLNTNYQTFKGYKVLGTQILGGLKISF